MSQFLQRQMKVSFWMSISQKSVMLLSLKLPKVHYLSQPHLPSPFATFGKQLKTKIFIQRTHNTKLIVFLTQPILDKYILMKYSSLCQEMVAKWSRKYK